MKLLTHQPLKTRRGWAVRRLWLNFDKAFDGLKWLVEIDCHCRQCRTAYEPGPGRDLYDVAGNGQIWPNRSGRQGGDIIGLN